MPGSALGCRGAAQGLGSRGSSPASPRVRLRVPLSSLEPTAHLKGADWFPSEPPSSRSCVLSQAVAGILSVKRDDHPQCSGGRGPVPFAVTVTHGAVGVVRARGSLHVSCSLAKARVEGHSASATSQC